jgi:hypothetical protein
MDWKRVIADDQNPPPAWVGRPNHQTNEPKPGAAGIRSALTGLGRTQRHIDASPESRSLHLAPQNEPNLP